MSLNDLTNEINNIEENDNNENTEAEKVEESLRDFIGNIINYYEKYKIGDSVLNLYQQEISNAETLLEVFDVMKKMFDQLMENIDKNADKNS